MLHSNVIKHKTNVHSLMCCPLNSHWPKISSNQNLWEFLGLFWTLPDTNMEILFCVPLDDALENMIILRNEIYKLGIWKDILMGIWICLDSLLVVQQKNLRVHRQVRLLQDELLLWPYCPTTHWLKNFQFLHFRPFDSFPRCNDGKDHKIKHFACEKDFPHIKHISSHWISQKFRIPTYKTNPIFRKIL